MKTWRILSILILCLLVAGLTACNSGSQQEITQQMVEVKRGDLAIIVNGGGNIEVGEKANLTFGVSGRIDEILVEEGDPVNKGDILAGLDTEALELALTQAQLGRIQAQTGITQAQLGIAQAQLGVTQAEAALRTARFNLDRMEDVDEAQDAVTDAEYDVKIAQARLKESLESPLGGDPSYWLNQVQLSQARLAEAQQELADLLADPDYASLIVDNLVIKKLQVKAAEESLEVARQSLEQAMQAVEQAEQALEQAGQAVKYARKQLDDATITATFDGIIAGVSADAGDTVSSATSIVYLIDPNSMQLKVEVDEIDIPLIKLHQKVKISVDALPDRQFEGEIALIGLLPKMEAGIVSYEVTISLPASDDPVLKIGMSATADIIAEHRENVLLVPSKAVTEDNQGNTAVQIMIDGQPQTNMVVTGISDVIQTEIISGLQEGDIIVMETHNRGQN